MNHHHLLNRILSTLVLFGCLSGVAIAGSGPYTISTDGTEVTDTKTGLIWQRCPLGMTWNAPTAGICNGTAATFTHENALKQAKTVATNTGVAWRLPNVKELVSIADKSRQNPAIDPTAFPNTPLMYFWSSSPYVGGSTNAWNVFFYNGFVNSGYTRSDFSHVRLVRVGQ